MGEKTMTKTLLATTALVGMLIGGMGSSIAAAPVTPPQAKSPTLKISGFTVFNMYSQSQSKRHRGRGGPQPHMAVDASDIYFTITGSSIGGLEYMYRVNLNAIPDGSPTLQQNYLQFKGGWGTLQAGNVRGPENTMIYDASRVIGGTGGFEGGYAGVYNLSAFVVNGNDLAGDTKNATKMVYYSPEMYGFQFGISYTPSTAHTGDSRLDNWSSKNADSVPGNKGIYGGFYRDNAPFGLRNVALGLTWKKEAEIWSIILSAAGLMEQSYYMDKSASGAQFGQRIKLRNAKGYQLGMILGYKDVRFAVGFLDNGKSRLPRDNAMRYGGVNLGDLYQGNSGQAVNVGLGYTMGAYQIAASWQGLSRKTDSTQKAKGNIYSATVDFTPFQGLKLYGEVDYAKTTTNQTAQDLEQRLISGGSHNRRWEASTGNNSATVGTLGAKVSF
jgi:Gram-negative porin